jgi:hypothetical protein
MTGPVIPASSPPSIGQIRSGAPSGASPQRGPEMNLIEHDLARGRMRDLQAEADAAARARRLIAARRWARRAERASRRAARASAAVR